MAIKQFVRDEQGQSLVLVAFILVTLFGFLALSVDGSNNYLQKRRMQNAADGAAVAGALALASGQTSEQALCATIRDYAVTRQGADSNQISMFYTPDEVPIQCQNQSTLSSADGVHVIVGHQFGAYVAAIVGHPSFNVVAESTAQYGIASSVVGASPVAIHDFGFIQGHTYKIRGENCARQVGHGQKEKCDLGEWNIAGANLATLDLSCLYDDTCSANVAQKQDWLRNGYGSSIGEGAILGGVPGGSYGWRSEGRCSPCKAQTASILTAASVGQTILIPVYNTALHLTNDQKCNPGSGSYDPGPDSGQCHNNPAYGQGEGTNSDYAIIIDAYTSDPTCNDVSRQCYYYLITSFAAFQISNVHNNGNHKHIDGQFLNYVAPQGEMGGTVNNGVIVIKVTQ